MKTISIYYILHLCISALLTAVMDARLTATDLYRAPGAEPFDLYDWKFLRENEDADTVTKHNGFLALLKKCQRTKTKESFFYVPKARAAPFMKKFTAESRLEGSYKLPTGSPDVRYVRYYEILLQISNNRIGLGEHSPFSIKIMKAMRERFPKKFEIAHGWSGDAQQWKSVEEFVEEVTKVTHLMMLMTLSLFKEHEHQFLTVHEVDNQLNFIKELWFRLEEGQFVEGRTTWESKVSDVLNFKAKDSQATSKAWRYGLCHNILRDWMEKNNLSIKDIDRNTIHEVTFAEILNKMIHFGNYKAVEATG
jgi:hypothetical protein